MATKRKLPVLEVQIDEDEGCFIDAVALVDEPAIMSNFIKLRKHTPEVAKRFELLANTERRELIGAALIPGLEIYRKDEETGEEYYITFSADTVRKAAQIFMKKGYQVNLNLQHTEKNANSYVFQSYIVDPARGMLSPTGLDLPAGSWVLGVKIDDAATWSEVQTGRANGFSVEGLFLMAAVKTTKKLDTFDEILLTLKNL